MSEKIRKISKKVEMLLASELPGESSHLKMRPEMRGSFKNKIQNKMAAVLIILFPDRSDIKIPFIKRTVYNGVHSGQISFPGGMKEASDRDLLHTAIRETSEETGISGQDIKVLGKISSIYIPVSNFEVQPYVAYLDYCPDFMPEPFEVEHMINIPLDHLFDVKNLRTEKWNLSGKEVIIPYFSYENFKIWGATAMILREFLDIIEKIQPDL